MIPQERGLFDDDPAMRQVKRAEIIAMGYHVPRDESLPACDHCLHFCRTLDSITARGKGRCTMTGGTVSFMGYCGDWREVRA